MSELKITDLKQGARNENRVNVFVNDKYAFSLDVAQVVDSGVKIGRVISEAELLELKKASELGKIYQRALEWVLIRPRSRKELRDYLFRKQTDFADVVVTRLTERGYVDDRKFAEHYVENRFVKKGISRKRLTMELKQKGVSSQLIEEVLEKSERDDADEIRKMIAKKWGRYDEDKLIQYLCRQGFSYALVSELVRSYEKD